MSATALALLFAAQVQAADAAIPEQITVTAPRVSDPAAVERFVRDVSVTTSGQLASFRSPICPAVFGLPEQYSSRVVRRIRAVAAQAGMQVAAAGCRPNVTLMVVNNSTRAVREMQRLEPSLFNGLPSGEYRRLTRGNDPVRAWSLVEVRNEDGTDFAPASPEDSGTGGGLSSESVMRVSSTSIIGLPTQRVITQSIILMEEQAMVGKTLTQIADYVAVRAITGARAGTAGGEGNSILSLFEPDGTAPRALSRMDLGYLRALQRTRGNDRAASHMNRISRIISGELATR